MYNYRQVRKKLYEMTSTNAEFVTSIERSTTSPRLVLKIVKKENMMATKKKAAKKPAAKKPAAKKAPAKKAAAKKAPAKKK